MFYKLLGMLVWRSWKWWLRQKYGSVSKAPKPVLAGGLLVVAGVLLAARQRAGGD